MILVDTGVFYAQLAEDDTNHLIALAFFRDVTEPLVTTKYVVFEAHGLMQRISNVRPAVDMRPAALRFLDSIEGGLARVLDVTDADYVAARAIVERHRGQDLLALRCAQLRCHGAPQDLPRRLVRRSLPTVREVRRPPLTRRNDPRSRVSPHALAHPQPLRPTHVGKVFAAATTWARLIRHRGSSSPPTGTRPLFSNMTRQAFGHLAHE